MPEELNIVTELAIILIAAGVFTIISKALKQPLILGYIVAGFIVGPYLGLFPQTSSEGVHIWSEIGIIFLLFSHGLEFSFKKLLKIGSSALITAMTCIVGMMAVGLVLGELLGWTMLESVFLGSLLSMGSTTVIFKTFEEMGLKDKPYSPVIFGTLVLEDLIVILVLVLLSTIAVSHRFEGKEMVHSFVKLVFFLILCFLVGIYVIPTILKKAKKFISDEILLIASIGLCFGMVVLANNAGFSSALGTFIIGSILSETVEGERIEHLTSNIKDLFGAIFFVSVGMMLDPSVIVTHWSTVLVLTVAVIAGIILFASTGVIIAGKGLDTAVHAGFTLSQLGECALIVAGLGCSLGVMRDFIYPVVIAVSVITTFTTPYMIRAADPVSSWLHRVLPEKVLSRINPPQGQFRANTLAEKNEWKRLLKNYFLRIGLYGTILAAIWVGSDIYLEKLLKAVLPSVSSLSHDIIHCAATLLLMLPFLYGMAVVGGDTGKSAGKLIKDKESNRWTIMALSVLRIILALLIMIGVIDYHFDIPNWTGLIILLAGTILTYRLKQRFGDKSHIEKRFFSNLNEKDEYERAKAPVSSKIRDKLAGYNVQLYSYSVPSDFSHIGKTLRDMPFRHTSGVNIMKITRGSHSILIPSGDERIYPGDRLLAVGTDKQIASFIEKMKESTVIEEGFESKEEFAVECITLGPDSSLTGKILKNTKMRSYGCMLISVMRDGKIITNPKPDFKFEEDDVLWLSGLKSSLKWFE